MAEALLRGSQVNSAFRIRTERRKIVMSALPPKADIPDDRALHAHGSACPLYPPIADMCGAKRDVRFVPKADMATCHHLRRF
jgi:hypothetical protein